MSFQEEKRESIKRYMLDKISRDDIQYIQKTMENFQISVTTVKRYLKECLDNRILTESEETQSGYKLTSIEKDFVYMCDERLDEDMAYYQDVRPLLSDISKEASDIWAYGFQEMMNNAIEHSEAEHIRVYLKKDHLYTEICIIDDGVGIFKKIQYYLKCEWGKEASYLDVIAELYKGKLTTDPANHSGEGIFFSSKLMSGFAIWSDNSLFYGGYGLEGELVKSHLLSYYTKLKKIGTMVVLKLENQSTRIMGEVFDKFAPVDEGFVRTRIPIKDVCAYGEPIARSQARRLMYRMEEFKYIEFDFKCVEFMGQGFADEIFRVWQNKYPDIELIVKNTNRNVLGMVKRVTMKRIAAGKAD